MLKLTKTGIGLLTRQYRSVLKKCWLLNIGLFALSTVILPKDASAGNIPNYYKKSDSYSRNEFDDIQSLNIPYVIVAGWGRLLALCACVLTAGNKVRSRVTGKEKRSGMTGNIKNNGLVNVVICNGGVIC